MKFHSKTYTPSEKGKSTILTPKVFLIKLIQDVICGKRLRLDKNVLAILYIKKSDKNVTVTFLETKTI